MEYIFTIGEQDLLAYQLYVSGRQTKKRRRISHILFAAASLIMAWYLYKPEDPVMGVYFAVIGAVIIVFYPLYSRWRYRNFFLRHIQRHYAERFGKESKLEITEDKLFVTDDGSHSEISITEISQIVELPENFLLIMKGGQSLILSKINVNDPEMLGRDIRALAQRGEIELVDELNWKWT